MQAETGTPLTPGAGAPPATPPRARPRLFWLVLGLAAVWVLVDQLTKAWAEAALAGRDPVPVLGELVQLRLVYNPGAAFSLATGATGLLTVLAGAVVVLIVWNARRLGSTAWAWALGLLLGGSSGNLYDRLFRPPGPGAGHVVDFLALPNFPVFNVADIGITAAACLIALLALRGVGLDGVREKDRARERERASEDD